jgi:hypothetical protein
MVQARSGAQFVTGAATRLTAGDPRRESKGDGTVSRREASQDNSNDGHARGEAPAPRLPVRIGRVARGTMSRCSWCSQAIEEDQPSVRASFSNGIIRLVHEGCSVPNLSVAEPGASGATPPPRPAVLSQPAQAAISDPPQAVIRLAPNEHAARRAWTALQPEHRMVITLRYEHADGDELAARELGCSVGDIPRLFAEAWSGWHQAMKKPQADGGTSTTTAPAMIRPARDDSQPAHPPVTRQPIVGRTYEIDERELKDLLALVEEVEGRALSPARVEWLRREGWPQRVAPFTVLGPSILRAEAEQSMTAAGVSWPIWAKRLKDASWRRTA